MKSSDSNIIMQEVILSEIKEIRKENKSTGKEIQEIKLQNVETLSIMHDLKNTIYGNREKKIIGIKEKVGILEINDNKEKTIYKFLCFIGGIFVTVYTLFKH